MINAAVINDRSLLKPRADKWLCLLPSWKLQKPLIHSLSLSVLLKGWISTFHTMETGSPHGLRQSKRALILYRTLESPHALQSKQMPPWPSYSGLVLALTVSRDGLKISARFSFMLAYESTTITMNLVLMTQTGLVRVVDTMPAVIADDICASQSFSIWFVVDVVVEYHMFLQQIFSQSYIETYQCRRLPTLFCSNHIQWSRYPKY